MQLLVETFLSTALILITFYRIDNKWLKEWQICISIDLNLYIKCLKWKRRYFIVCDEHVKHVKWEIRDAAWLVSLTWSFPLYERATVYHFPISNAVE